MRIISFINTKFFIPICVCFALYTILSRFCSLKLEKVIFGCGSICQYRQDHHSRTLLKFFFVRLKILIEKKKMYIYITLLDSFSI